MKKNIISMIFLLVLSLAPWACKPFPILPLPVPDPFTPTATKTNTSTANLTFTGTATPTVTATPTPFPPVSAQTFVSTPGCGFTTIAVATPIIPAAPFYPALTPPPTNNYPLMGQNLVIRNLADWQAYYGSTSAPAPPVDFNRQMLVIDLRAVNVNALASGGTFISNPLAIQNVCWNNNQITLSCTYTTYLPCDVQVTPGFTPTPPQWTYMVTAVIVPLSSLPAYWNVTPIIYACPAI